MFQMAPIRQVVVFQRVTFSFQSLDFSPMWLVSLSQADFGWSIVSTLEVCRGDKWAIFYTKD